VRSAQVLAVRALLLGALLASAGCFRPKNLANGFSCPEAGPCPDGLVCNANFICATSYDAGVIGTGGSGGTTGTGGTGGKGGAGNVDGGGIDRPCTGAVASCQPSDAGLCDPVCNTGCGACYQKCSVNGNGALTCNAPMGPRSPALLGPCDQTSTFSLDETDDCQPGQLCANTNSCGARCYKFCRTSSDCPDHATCSRDAGGGHTVCDVPPIPCDPVAGAAPGSSGNSGCTGGLTVNCYLSATSATTLCDCQNIRANGTGNGTKGDFCSHSRDCFAGLVCYDPNGNNNMQCWPVCRLPGDGGVDITNTAVGESKCTTGPGACNPIRLSDGTTNPTFGFCND